MSKRQLRIKLHRQLYEICFRNHVLSKLSVTVPNSMIKAGFPASNGKLSKKYIDIVSKAVSCLNSLLQPLYSAARGIVFDKIPYVIYVAFMCMLIKGEGAEKSAGGGKITSFRNL